jgi:hypothetical protein
VGRTKPSPSYWLIVKHESQMEVLTIRDTDQEETLPIFSFEEEARLFLECGASKSGWGVRRTSPGELTSVLFGSCANVERVALDPVPEMDAGMLMDLMCIGRKEFVQLLLRKRKVTDHIDNLKVPAKLRQVQPGFTLGARPGHNR